MWRTTPNASPIIEIEPDLNAKGKLSLYLHYSSTAERNYQTVNEYQM